mmetsp:Transcript_752/g.1274  ORF Transcript_752/g.1274 Transcript_752/m.1274 type:complete len:85 (+) Transcript_752:862-1116(+)
MSVVGGCYVLLLLFVFFVPHTVHNTQGRGRFTRYDPMKLASCHANVRSIQKGNLERWFDTINKMATHTSLLYYSTTRPTKVKGL